jgi:hypothetical protein
MSSSADMPTLDVWYARFDVDGALGTYRHALDPNPARARHLSAQGVRPAD